MRGHDFFARARVAALMQTLALAAAVLLGALVYPLVARSSTAPVPGAALAPDFVLKSTDGRNLRLSEYRGDVVVLAFWASWCGACREALAGLNDIAAAPGADRPVVLGVSLDGDAGRASSVAQSLGLRFPTLVDSRQDIGRLYDVETLPLTLLVDRDGVVRGTWAAGPPPPAELNRALEEIGP
jgi:peroxiredoxin